MLVCAVDCGVPMEVVDRHRDIGPVISGDDRSVLDAEDVVHDCWRPQIFEID